MGVKLMMKKKDKVTNNQKTSKKNYWSCGTSKQKLWRWDATYHSIRERSRGREHAGEGAHSGDAADILSDC